MICSIIGALIIVCIVAGVLAFILQMASKMVLKEAIEYGDAFKCAFVASIISHFSDMGLEKVFATEDGGTSTAYWLSSIGVTYLIWVLCLSIIVDLTLGESLVIGAVFTVLKVLLAAALVLILSTLMIAGTQVGG